MQSSLNLLLSQAQCYSTSNNADIYTLENLSRHLGAAQAGCGKGRGEASEICFVATP